MTLINKNIINNILLLSTCVMAFTNHPALAKPLTTAHNASIPQPILQKINELNLSPANLSYIITPLNSPATQSVNKLPHATHAITASSSQNTVTAFDNSTAIKPELFTPLKNSVSYQSKTPRIPASTMKLIPTFIALDTLGANFHWFTRVYHTGVRTKDTLYGNLIIKASGDPKLTHADLTQLLYQVQQTGITHINGNIIIDPNIFTNVYKDPATFDGKPLRPYNTSPNAFLTNFSTIEVTSYPLNKQTAQLVYTPTLANTTLPNQIKIRQAKCDASLIKTINPQWKIKANANPHQTKTTDELVFKNALPNDCGIHTFYIAHPNPAQFSQNLIKATWLNLGNTLSGKVITQTNVPSQTNADYQPSHTMPPNVSILLPIVTHVSNPLSQQINDINHYSNNVMTEQLTLSIAAYQNGKRHEQTGYSQALDSINTWWQTNLTSPPPSMTNGSGLCRNCRITVNGLNELLGFAYTQPSFNIYVNSLGIAGVSGTISSHKYRMPTSKAIGRAWIKTGTLDNVTAMAGYVKGLSGQDYSVVAIINLTNTTVTASHYRPVLDTIIDWTARH